MYGYLFVDKTFPLNAACDKDNISYTRNILDEEGIEEICADSNNVCLNQPNSMEISGKLNYFIILYNYYSIKLFNHYFIKYYV